MTPGPSPAERLGWDQPKQTDQSQLDWVRAVVAKVTYKPGWRLHVEVAKHEGREWLILCAESTEPESRADGDRFQYRNYGIGNCETVHQVLAWVRKAIHTWEVHEANEFLRFDGELIHDPHQCPDCLAGNWANDCLSFRST